MRVSRSRTMHPKSPSLTIGRTKPKVSDDLDIGRFDSNMTIEKHLRSVSRAPSDRLGILMTCWRVFHDRLLLVRCFGVISCPFLQYCSAVWCSAVDTHLKLLNSVLNGTCFFNGGVFEYTIANRQSIAVLSIPDAPSLLCSTCTEFVIAVTRGAFVLHRYTGWF